MNTRKSKNSNNNDKNGNSKNSMNNDKNGNSKNKSKSR